jgi:hypothetical protein
MLVVQQVMIFFWKPIYNRRRRFLVDLVDLVDLEVSGGSGGSGGFPVESGGFWRRRRW